MIRRNTNQRQIVFDTIKEYGHITSEDLILIIMKKHDDISLASIYRNITILLEDNLIKKVKLGQTDVYETVKEKHYHYQCKECGKIFDIPLSELPDELNKIDSIGNEKVCDCDIVFYGECHECQNKNLLKKRGI